MIISHEKCFVCGNIANFRINDDYVLYREATCDYCGASIRNSDLARMVTKYCLKETTSIKESINKLGKINILEAQSLGPINKILNESDNYTSFEYFDNIDPGKYKNGVMCNDLMNLTFSNESFDLVITQDVFEHISNPKKAFKEISRVLKIGGYHIFTVPLHENSKTKSRIGLRDVYHLDSIREQGVIVYTDWGNDICQYADVYKMRTIEHDLHIFYNNNDITNVDESYDKYLITEALKYYKYNSIVFVSKKYKKNGIKNLLDKIIRKKQT